MKEIIIKMECPSEAQNLVLLLLKNGYTPQSATINYNIRTGLPGKFRRLDQYPLILNGTLNDTETRVLVSPLSAGYRSPGSFALRKILQSANFYFEEDDIFTLRRFNSDGKLSIIYSHH